MAGTCRECAGRDHAHVCAVCGGRLCHGYWGPHAAAITLWPEVSCPYEPGDGNADAAQRGAGARAAGS